MIPITKFRNGMLFELDNEPWRVLEYKHVHLSRGAGTITIRARNLKTGSVRTLTFKSGERLPEVQVERKLLTYLYKSDEMFVFMDPDTFEQTDISAKTVGGVGEFLVDGQQVTILLWDSDPIDVDIPSKITLTIKEAGPGVKGDTVGAASKDAILETGKKVRVPLFINQGDKIVVDTRDGTYVERAK